MSATHAYISTTSCACWDVDAYNRCGVYAAGALDNATFVVCGKPAVDSADGITGYHFPVTLADNATLGAWVVNTPEVGTTLEMQMLADPREFYNEAGKPMSIKYLTKMDCIEVNKTAFASGALPTNEGYVTIGANGKLVAASVAPNTAVTYFKVLGFKNVAVGNDTMKVVVLECAAN